MRLEIQGLLYSCRSRCGQRLVIISALLLFSLAGGVVTENVARAEDIASIKDPINDPIKILNQVHNAPQENMVRSEKLAELFRVSIPDNGSIHRQSFHHNREQVQNLWVTLPATRPDRGTFIIGAHTDTMPGSAGVVDNWSSCVMLAALYQRLQFEEREHTFIFIGFTGEEHGQYGSRAFMQKMSRKMRSRIRGMINLECLGVGRVRTWINRSADDLEAIFQITADEMGIPAPKQVLFGFGADSVSFQRAGIPAMTLHSLSGPMLSIINNSKDDGSHINDSRYLEAFNLITRFLLKLDRHDARLKPTDQDSRLRPARTALRGLPNLNRTAGSGVKLDELARGSYEYRAGLRQGDIVTAIDGAPVHNPSELKQALLTIAKGSVVEMIVSPIVVSPAEADYKVVTVEY